MASIMSNLQQGTLETTGNQLDLALQGNGYFVVNSGTQNFYTRAGSFGVNSQGYLVDPATGDFVQRLSEPVGRERRPPVQPFKHQATTTSRFQPALRFQARPQAA